MEMPEQEVPVVFSEMLQMFPNIPHDIIWMYVQRYSSDAEKCAQMLNLQNGKYSGLQLPTLDNSRNLDKYNNPQASDLMPNSGTMLDNNNDVPLTKQLCFPNNESNTLIESCVNDNEQTEPTSYDSHSTYSSSQVFSIDMCENTSTDSPRNLGAAISYNEPLILDIVPDDIGVSHSWRPNISSDVLCSDLFVPSPVFENFQLPDHCIPNLNFQHSASEFHFNPDTEVEEPWRFPSNSTQMFYCYPLDNGRNYGNDISSYLHCQKSQMNAMRYEVIKAKIELSDLKDSVERLDSELKEKMQSKNEQDIVNLNKEIEKLRIDCQCLCSEVDENGADILAEIDEGFYEKSSSTNTEIQSGNSSSNSHKATSKDILEESSRWQCVKCTFENHPAINVCEMCHLPKPVPRRPSYLPLASSSSYCEPKEKSLSVES